MTGYFVAIVVAIHLTLGAHAISGSVHSLRRSIDRASHEIVNFGRMVEEDPSEFSREYPAFLSGSITKSARSNHSHFGTIEETPESGELKGTDEKAKTLEEKHTGKGDEKTKETEKKNVSEESKKLEDVAGRLEVASLEPTTGKKEEGELTTAKETEKLAEEQKKIEDVAGRLKVANVEATESKSEEDELRKIREQQQTETARQLLEKEKCIKEEILKLKDVAGRIMAQEVTASPANEEAAKIEEEELAKLKKAATEEMEKAKAEGENTLKLIETTPAPIDEIKRRAEEEEARLAAEEAKIAEKEKEEDCQTAEEMKTYLKAGPEGEPETDPVKHKSQLELKKAEATTEGDLAAVEAEAAQADTDEAHKLLEEASEEAKEAENEDKASREELAQPAAIKETLGKPDPCLENKELASQAVLAAQEADVAKKAIEEAMNKLKTAEKLATDAREEADKAKRQAEEAKRDPCEDEAHKKLANDAERTSQEAQKKAKELEEAVLTEKGKLEALKTTVVNDEIAAEHTAASHMSHKPEECLPHKEACGEAKPPPNPCFNDEKGFDAQNAMKQYNEKENREIDSEAKPIVSEDRTTQQNLNNFSEKENLEIESAIASQMLSRLVNKNALSPMRNIAISAPARRLF